MSHLIRRAGLFIDHSGREGEGEGGVSSLAGRRSGEIDQGYGSYEDWKHHLVLLW